MAAIGKGMLMGSFLVVVREIIRRVKSSKIRLGLFMSLCPGIGKEGEKIIYILLATKGVVRRSFLKRLAMFISSW